jgi:hypothetical protein
MTRVLTATTVLLLHTSAAWAQQGPSGAPLGAFAEGPGSPPPPPAATPAVPEAPLAGPPSPASSKATAPTPPNAPPVPPAAAAPPVPAPADGYPPGYGPPPGYIPPPGYSPPPRQTYYGPPQGYGQPSGYGAGGYGAPSGAYRYQQPPPPARRVTDRPFTIGGGIGFGGLKLTDSSGGTWSQGGLSYTARLGFGLRPGLILLWDIEGSSVEHAVANGGFQTYSQTAHLAALQMFVGDRLFLKGGFGVAQFSVNDSQFTDLGGAAMGGIGVELVQGWNWSLDVESTATAAFYHGDTMINWSLASFALNLF